MPSVFQKHILGMVQCMIIYLYDERKHEKVGYSQVLTNHRNKDKCLTKEFLILGTLPNLNICVDTHRNALQ